MIMESFKMIKLEEQDEIGKSRLEQLKRYTFFSEMELRALFNEYKPLTNEMDRKNYISQAAYRLKRKFEKLMRTLKVLQEIEDIAFEDYEKPVQNALEEIGLFWLEWIAEFNVKETEELSVEEIISKIIYWNIVLFKRMDKEQIEILDKWAEQVAETLTTDQLVDVVNVYTSLLDERAAKENKELGFFWSRVSEPYFVLMDEEEETEEKEEKIKNIVTNSL